jgi:alpha-beta hydrolase superfamily lysophospholipase
VPFHDIREHRGCTEISKLHETKASDHLDFLCCYSLFVAGVWVTGTILSAPAHQSVGDAPPDLAARAVQFQSQSGATIKGWFIKGKKGAGAIILMHGVRANRLSMVDRARFLSRAGFSVLLFDFQSHGESSGDHITFGYLESRDAQAAVEFIRTNAPDERIGVLGISMGGAATLLASPPLDVDAIVFEMVYPSINQAVSNRLTMRLGGWVGTFTPLLTWQLKPRLGVSAEALQPIKRVGEITVPKLFIVGAEDKHTTIEESRQMFNVAAEPKELWIVERAAHIDLHAARKKNMSSVC